VIIWGPAHVGRGFAGDVVTTRVVRFGSQKEQVAYLRSVIDEYRANYAIRSRARDIVFRQRGCRPKDKRAQALALASWVQQNITYVEEKPEIFQTPTSTVAQGYGDCDDHVQILGAMLESIGIDARLVALQWPDRDGGSSVSSEYFRHIFVQGCFVEGGRYVCLPLDTTLARSVYDLTDPIEVSRRMGRRVTVFVG
jgi:hypothetical protein